MPQLAQIAVSAAVEVGRFDAEFFRPHLVEVARVLSRVRTEPVTRCSRVSDGNHAAISDHFSHQITTGPRYLRGQDIGGFFLGDRNPVYVPMGIYRLLARSHILPGDVLVSIVGTIGALSLVPPGTPSLTGSCKIAILRPRRDQISPEYLAAFLASKYGQLQMERLTRGAVQMGLILADFPRLRIVRLGAVEETIKNLILRAHDALTLARSTYDAAGSLFEEELGVSTASSTNPPSYTATIAQMATNVRWDAEYYRPRYREIAAAVLTAGRIAVQRLDSLQRHIAYLTNGHTPRYHDLTEGEVPFITAEHVSDFRIDFNSEKRILLRHHRTELARSALSDGDLLVTIKGKVGNCSMVRGSRPPLNINQDVALLRLRSSLNPFYLAGWLNSKSGRALVTQRTTGGINPFLSLGNLRLIPVPIVSESSQAQIGIKLEQLIAGAASTEAAASSLIREAVDLIERTIADQAA